MIFKNWTYKFNNVSFIDYAPSQQPPRREYHTRHSFNEIMMKLQSTSEEKPKNDGDMDINELIKNFRNRKRAKKI